MRKIITAILFFTFLAGYAQTDEEFKPSGAPFAKIYFNYHYNFDDETAFEIQRAYFGYKYNLSKSFAADITLDVGSPDVEVVDSNGTELAGGTSLQMTAFLKTAGITYKKGNLKVQAGLIGLQQFKIQESQWDHRYLYKSFQDEYKFGPSADLGVLISYKFFDQLSADLTLRNGEGYKKLQADNAYLAGFGLTLMPVKGLTARAYFDYMNKDGVAQLTFANYVGYTYKDLSLGAEYNIQQNHKNVQDEHLSGLSFYASYDISEKFEVFGRFDQLKSANDWNIGKDESYIILGTEFSPVKKIQIALNYRGEIPAEAGADMSHAAYVNCQFAF